VFEILSPPLLGNIPLFLTQISRYSNMLVFQTLVEKIPFSDSGEKGKRNETKIVAKIEKLLHVDFCKHKLF
jgi:hypothetical protein